MQKPNQLRRREENPRSIYSDSSLEFITACDELNWHRERSTLHRSETDGIAEVYDERKKAPSSVSVQSGLHVSWWAETMECYCYVRNVQDLLADGQPFHGPIIPFGAFFIQKNSYIRKRPCSSVSGRHTSSSWSFHEVRLERGWKWDW